jgi:superfamily II DNA/RNA helicase
MTATFTDLGVPREYAKALSDQGINQPFPIQTSTLPDSIAGRDVLGRGRTGSGKTIAFCLPVAIRLSGKRSQPGAPRAMILVPTRELASQVADTMRPLAQAGGLSVATVVGGVPQNPQVRALRRGTDILVATPGRLEDLIRQGHCRLGDVRISVLDEADHLADLGFLPASKRLLDQTARDGQRLLFSATLDGAVGVLVRKYLRDPATHHVDAASAPVPSMSHHMLTVRDADKQQVVRELVSGEGRTLAFTRTKHGAKKLAKQLTAAGIPAVDLHGNLSQAARKRNLAAFSTGQVRVLVATDIAARGIHVDDIDMVVHVDPAAEHKTYLHRCGRTARAGAEGKAISVGTASQRRDVTRMLRMAEVKPLTVDVHPGHAAITDLVGPAAPKNHTPVFAQAEPTPRGSRNHGQSRHHGRARRSGNRSRRSAA